MHGVLLSRRQLLRATNGSLLLLATGARAAEPSHSSGEASIEVSTDFQRIVTDAGAGGYQAFPDICRTRNGDLICVFYAGYSHISHPTPSLPQGGRICGIRSRDDGKTWSAPFVVADTPDDDRDPSIVCLPDGRLLVNFFRYGLNGECDTCIAQSRDNGNTWFQPAIVMPSFATSTPIRRLKSGRLLLIVYTVDGNGKRSFPAVCLSDNGGRTWSTPHPIGERAGKTLDETDILERSDGTLLAVMREVMCGAVSKDRGETWGDVYNLGFPGHCPYLLMTRCGVLIMAHRLPGTALHYSLDEGRTWVGPVAIDSTIGAYPSMVELKDGTVLCVYYEEGKGSAIRARRIAVART